MKLGEQLTTLKIQIGLNFRIKDKNSWALVTFV